MELFVFILGFVLLGIGLSFDLLSVYFGIRNSMSEKTYPSGVVLLPLILYMGSIFCFHNKISWMTIVLLSFFAIVFHVCSQYYFILLIVKLLKGK